MQKLSNISVRHLHLVISDQELSRAYEFGDLPNEEAAIFHEFFVRRVGMDQTEISLLIHETMVIPFLMYVSGFGTKAKFNKAAIVGMTSSDAVETLSAMGFVDAHAELRNMLENGYHLTADMRIAEGGLFSAGHELSMAP